MLNFYRHAHAKTVQETPDHVVRQYYRPDRPTVQKCIQSDRQALVNAGLSLRSATYTGHKSDYCLLVTYGR